MAYEYTDPRIEGERDAQPDVEVFFASDNRFFYAFGHPGCRWDSAPYGPFPTYEAALDDARRHGDCFEDYAPEETEL